MMDWVIFVLAYADTWAPLIPIYFIVTGFRVIKYPLEIIWLLVYLVVCVLLFGYSNYLADRSINNLYVYHLFTIAELILLLKYFEAILVSKKKQLINYLICLLTGVFILNSFYFEDTRSFNGNSSTLEFFFIIVFCLIYYFELTNTANILYFQINPVFWIVSGLFLYCSCCIVVFALYKYATINYTPFVLNFWIFQVIMYIIKNLLIAKGVICYKRQK